MFWEIELSELQIFFYFSGEMKLSSPKIKIFLIFFSENSSSYISGNETFKKTSYISRENFPSFEKMSYILENRNLLFPSLKSSIFF